MRPALFRAHSGRQLYFASLLSKTLGEGPAATVANYPPDMDVFCNRGAKDIIPLWRDAAATEPNVARGLLGSLATALHRKVDAEELFSYAYAILANPGYVARFWEEMETPGPRLAITKDAALFASGVGLGRRLIWLHTYGERMVPAGEKPGRVPQGTARCMAAVPHTPEDYPEDFDYLDDERAIRVGKGGKFGPVPSVIWSFSVSGLEVVKSWLGYRMKNRAGRKSSALDDIRPVSWTPAMTDEFLNLLWVLEHTLAMRPALDALLAEVVGGPCFAADELPRPATDEREPNRRSADPRQPALV